jgi:plastocyanin
MAMRTTVGKLRHVKASLVFGALAMLVAATPASAAGGQTITITHVMRGCHAWDLGHGPMKPTMSLTVKRGTVVRFVNNDVMLHRLIRLSGPRVELNGANMNRMASSARARFVEPGTYRFKTVFGAFFPWAASMGAKIGKMNVLHLTVNVK